LYSVIYQGVENDTNAFTATLQATNAKFHTRYVFTQSDVEINALQYAILQMIQHKTIF